MELSKETIFIIRKLYNKRRIGGKHTEEKNCFRALNGLDKQKKKEIIEEWTFCINSGMIIREMKTGEWHVSLNPRKLKEINEILGNKNENNNRN